MVFLFPSYFALIFPCFAALVNSLAGGTPIEIIATTIVSIYVALNIHRSCGLILLAFVLGFGLDAVSVLYDGSI